MEKLFPVLGALLVVVGVVWVVAWKLGVLKKSGEGATGTDDPSAAGKDVIGLGYRRREEVLSAGERAFMPALREAVAIVAAERKLPVPVVFASVRLAEILAVAPAPASPDKGTSKETKGRGGWQSAFNRIASKQVDFVICDPDRTRPLLIVELDDATHARADRTERDGFIDRACASAGMPILHVRAAANYPHTYPRTLAREIAACLAPI